MYNMFCLKFRKMKCVWGGGGGGVSSTAYKFYIYSIGVVIAIS